MTPERPQYVNPGPDATWNPVFVPDAYREKPGKKEGKMYLISESELTALIARKLPLNVRFGDDPLYKLISDRGPVAQQAPDCNNCSYKRFAANWENAEAHDARVRKEILDDLFTSLKEGGIFALGNRLDELRSEVSKK